jgi:hypothetical protein
LGKDLALASQDCALLAIHIGLQVKVNQSKGADIIAAARRTSRSSRLAVEQESTAGGGDGLNRFTLPLGIT